jgi:group I intron endonuclease
MMRIDFEDTGCGVYQIRCRATRKVYIGSTSCFARRWNEHREDLVAGRHGNYKLQRDWDKYGANSFEFSVVEYTHPATRLNREQFYINFLRAVDEGYNIQRNTQPNAHPRSHSARRIRLVKRSLIRQILGHILVTILYTVNHWRTS